MSQPTTAFLPISLAPEVVFVPADDGSARLLDLGGAFYALSPVGADMLRGALDHGIGPTIAAMAADYNADPAVIGGDMESLLAQLEQARLVVRTGANANRSRRTAMARLFSRTMLRSPLRRSPTAVLLCARACFALFGWSNTVNAWRELVEQTGADGGALGEAEITAIDEAVRNAAARLPSVNCKERALAAWLMLASRGVPATLVVGIQWFPLSGHCWCETGGRTLTDTEGHCRTYQPVARYTPAFAPHAPAAAAQFEGAR